MEKDPLQIATDARKLAVIAISVSVGTALASIVAPIVLAKLVTQNVRIDEEQLRSINFVTTPTSGETP